MPRSSLLRPLLVCAGLAVVLAACDAPSDTTQLIEQALVYRADGDLNAAIIELRNAVKADPKSELAQDLLVTTYVDRAAIHRADADLRSSVALLENALWRDKDNQEIRAWLVQDYLALAEQAAAAGNVNNRIGALKGAVRAGPENAQARLNLGIAYLAAGLTEDAEKELLGARDRGIDLATLLEPLGATWLRQGQFAEVLATFQATDPALIDVLPIVLVMRGRAHAERNELKESEIAFARAHAMEPRMIDAIIGLARLALGRGDLAAAETQMVRASAIAADDPEVLALQGDVYRRLDYPAGAAAAYTRLLATRPDDRATRMALANVLLGEGDLTGAVTHIEHVLAQSEAHLQAKYMRAFIAYRQRDYATAREHVEVILGIDPTHLPSTLLYGATAFALDNLAVAATQLQRYVNNDPSHPVARRLLGVALFQLGNADAALAVLGDLGAGGLNEADLLALLSDAAIFTGDFEAGQDYLRRLNALAPKDTDLQVQLGIVEAVRGDMSGAIRALKAAVARDPAHDRARLGLTLASLQAGDFDAALDGAAWLAEAAPQDSAGYVLAALAHVGQGELDLAKQRFADAVRVDPDNRFVRVMLAELAAQDGDFTAASLHLDQAMNGAPDLFDLLLRRADVDLRAGDLATAEQTLQRALKKRPRDSRVRILIARLHLAANRPERALAATEGYLEREGDNPALREVVGQALLALRQGPEALTVLKRLAAAQPDSATAHYLLARAHGQVGGSSAQRNSLAATLRLDPGNVAAMADLTSLLMQAGDRAGVDRVLAELRAAAPVVALTFDSRLAMSEGRYQEAVSLLTRVAAEAPSSRSTIELAEAQRVSGEPGAAIATLEHWLDRFPGDNVARFVLADRYIESRRLADAIAGLEVIEAADPGNVAVLNNIAWTRLQLGDAQAALPYAERALQKAGDNPNIMDTAAMVLLDIGEAERAARLWARALEIDPTNANYRKNLAAARAMLGSE